MIIVELHGGLGNQMFQYAIGKKLALKHNTELKLDTVRFGISKYPEPVQNAPNISANASTSQNTSSSVDLKAQIKSLLMPLLKVGSKIKRRYYTLIDLRYYHSDLKRIYELDSLNVTSRKLDHVDIFLFRLNRGRYKIVEESNTSFQADALNCSENAYLLGFWQSEKYFSDIRDVLLEEFKVTRPIDTTNQELLSKIQSTESVFIHVRRGDYVNESAVTKSFSVCNMDYFNAGIKYIKEKIPNATFFIFSDEPEWAKENIDVGSSEKYVSYNPGSRAYDDLRLMNACKHSIISNSSFSWWASWLNRNNDKIVIAPKRWFADNEAERYAKDIVPESWIRL
jgi:hypothetical protein